jgi:hypothetical protein
MSTTRRTRSEIEDNTKKGLVIAEGTLKTTAFAGFFPFGYCALVFMGSRLFHN